MPPSRDASVRDVPAPGQPTPADAPAPAWPGDRGGHHWPKDRETLSPDGTRIRYTVRGRADGPWLVMCAGFMCPDNFWMYLAPPLLDRYRIVFLNYRGVGASEDPRHPGYRALNVTADDYTIPMMASDVVAVMETEGVTDATVIGHSMGCQVALEVWHQAADRVAALALVTGPYASPLHTFYGSKVGAYLFPFAYLGVPLLPRPIQKAIPKILTMPDEVVMLGARLTRALGPHAPTDGMRTYFEHFSNADPLIVLKIAHGMHRFDAEPFMDEIDVPVLVVVGEHDTFTPPDLGLETVELLPDAELVEIREGTHGALIEFPDEIRDALEDFLHRRLGHDAAAPTGDPGRWFDPLAAPSSE